MGLLRTLLVFSCNLRRQELVPRTVLYKRLAYTYFHAIKREQSYSTVIAWIRCHLCFSLLRSAVKFLRGVRSHHHMCESINLATLEGKIPALDILKSLPFSPVDSHILNCYLNKLASKIELVYSPFRRWMRNVFDMQYRVTGRGNASKSKVGID